ncbi:cytochrome c biogenesis CcdA family protein [Tepidiforma sp.]|uniref:cytochrome c biogenesis CcdA family protein n=1 Tax=Tepidiforma sp. TaxID=2682230 RepID=UPI002ADDAA08|nr:cytochrome c biogenesis protein CcdA [Tepidiforma sp.]
MARAGTVTRPRFPRNAAYLVLMLLAAVPVVAFALGPLSSSSFSLRGPGGPFLAFSAGVLSFVSPCVLPLVPIFLAQISGASIVDGRLTASRRVTFTHAVAFVTGLSLVFIALGAAAGLFGSYVLVDNQQRLGEIAGAALVLMGVLVVPPRGRADPLRSALLLVVLTGVFVVLAELGDLHNDRARLLALGVVLLVVWLRFAGYLQLAFFQRTFEVRVGANHGVSYLRSAFVGGAFALGWTPCVGPILGAILTLAATSGEALQGTYLLAWYAAGMAVPFLITGLMVSDATRVLKRIQRYGPVLEVVSGLMLIVVGVLLVSGRLTALNEFFTFAEFNQGL